jgi:PAS domain S-box-containing protein/diguanylate cyclase (GGDEF)-like protein
MPQIIIERTEASLIDRLRSYKVIINGESRGTIKPNEKWAYTVPPGTHVVRFRIDHFLSAPLKVAVINRTRLICRSGFWHAFGMLAMLADDSWVTIREEDEAPEIEKLYPADLPQPVSGAKKRAVSARFRKSKPTSAWAFRLSGPRMDEATQARRLLEMDLREAVSSWALDLRYEPQVDLQTKRVIAFEALLRWHHPVRGTVPTSQFVPLAQELGLTTAISQQVLERACREAATWPDGIRVGVNISERQLADPALPAVVTAALNKAGLHPNRLELEIGEAVLTGGRGMALAALQALHHTGARLVIDGYGTAQTPLTDTSGIAFSKLKISRDVVAGKHPDQDNLEVIRAAIELCNDTEMTCCACGVEAQEQAATLLQQNCAQAQGRFYGPLVTAREVLPSIAAINRLPIASVPALPAPNLPFPQIVDAANDMFIVTDADLGPEGPRIVYVNQAFTRITGYTADEAIGRSPKFLQGPYTSQQTRARIHSALRETGVVREKLLNYDKSGAPYWVDLRIVPIRSKTGAITHFAGIQRDVTTDKRRLDELERREDRDVVTGISNRRALLRAIESEIAGVASRPGEAAGALLLCVAFVGVDHLVPASQAGEKIAQALLMGVADRLAENVRRCDIVGRVSEDVFAVCMPAVSLVSAEAIADSLSRAVASAPFETPEGPMSATVSVGVVSFTIGDTIASVIKRAEAAMVQAKRGAEVVSVA